jgi:hypothetical protein
MADSRPSFAQTLALLDNIEKLYQLEQAVSDGGFTGEGTGTLLYGLRYLVETRLRAWTSDSGIRDVVPAATNALKLLDTTNSAGTNRIINPLVANILRSIVACQANYDTTYSSFWDWFNTNKAAATSDKVLGNVTDLMVAAGIAVDPDHCVPPAHLKLGYLAYTGVATATLTAINKIDPLKYKGHTVEVYCVARNAIPDEIAVTITKSKISTGGPGDTGAVSFPLTILSTLAATQCMDVPEVDSDTAYDLADSALTLTSGGKNGDQFYLRVKEYRAAVV